MHRESAEACRPMSSRRPPNHRSIRNGCTTLVVVDQKPVRNHWLTECRRLMRTLERERRKLELFQSRDQPAFKRWLARLFGARRTELRELAEEIAEKQRWVEAIELEVLRSDCTPVEAYRRVKQRFEQPEQSASSSGHGNPFDEPDFEDPDGPGSAPLEERLREYARNTAPEVFEEMLRELFGLDPRRMPRGEYQEMYVAFRRHFQQQCGLTDEQAGFGPADSDGPPDEEEKSLSRRCKDLYRQLVRTLHPDTRADSDPTVGRIWHEVQEAYAAEDLERLQVLAAHAEVHGSLNGTSTVWELQRVSGELEESVSIIRRELRRARKQPEWGFGKSRERDRETLAKQFEEGLEVDLEVRKTQLQALRDQLRRWSRTARWR